MRASLESSSRKACGACDGVNDRNNSVYFFEYIIYRILSVCLVSGIPCVQSMSPGLTARSNGISDALKGLLVSTKY